MSPLPMIVPAAAEAADIVVAVEVADIAAAVAAAGLAADKLRTEPEVVQQQRQRGSGPGRQTWFRNLNAVAVKMANEEGLVTEFQ